jgi:hypothetical protein
MKLNRGAIPLNVISTPYFLIPYFVHSKMADVQTYEVNGKLAPFNVRP